MLTRFAEEGTQAHRGKIFLEAAVRGQGAWLESLSHLRPLSRSSRCFSVGLPLSPGKPGQKLETQASVQAATRPRPLPPARPPSSSRATTFPVPPLPWGRQNKRSSTYLACSSKFGLQPRGGLPGAGTPGQRRRWGQEAPLVSGFRVPAPSSPSSPAFWETPSRLPLNSVNLGVLCGREAGSTFRTLGFLPCSAHTSSHGAG